MPEIKQKQKAQEELTSRPPSLPLPDVVPDGDAHYGQNALPLLNGHVALAPPNHPGLGQPHRNHGLLGGALANLFVIVGFAAFAYTVKVSAAKRERKVKKEPNQYTEPFNTTLSNSEELHGHPKRGLVGPPGPPGPQGPPGAPGAEVTREVLLQEFKEILKGKACENFVLLGSTRASQEVALQTPPDFLGQALELSLAVFVSSEAMERRAALAVPAQPSQLPPLLLSLEEMPPHRRVEEAFHCKLKGQVTVDKKTLVELQNFQSLFTAGIAVTAGWIYPGARNCPGITSYHSELKSKVQLRARDNVRVLICIESLCHRHTSLEVIAGLESNSKIFTIYVHGLLQLQAGQYTSIFVDNSAGAPITIQNGSDFMGMFLGA
ncbi:adipolin [Willisornis vidua]|uniref:Adipolin n=1 Tax=Willisornis vidua TaxID=1566151 RepID=A0ABQ9DQ52_9PASS|nr:adipolin [Willisornis vidua]